MQRLALGRTMIIISHSLETVKNCTQLLQMNGGRLQQIDALEMEP